MARIIMVDDDEIVCELVRETLSAHGHAVGILDNGKDAFPILKARRPDLAILDCNMPGLTGLLLLRAMRDSHELWETPVLMLTGRTSTRDVDLARNEGVSDYMTKPFDPEELAFRVDALLSKHKRPPVAAPGRLAKPDQRFGLRR